MSDFTGKSHRGIWCFIALMKVTSNFSEINFVGKFNKIVLESSYGQFQIAQIYNRITQVL